MRKFLLVLVIAGFLLSGSPTSVHAQQANFLPKINLTPEDSFYFLKELVEGLQEFFTADSVEKAHFEMKLVGERISEIRMMLSKKGVYAKGISLSQSKLKNHLDNVDKIIEKQRAKGQDVSALAQNLSKDLTTQRETLSQIFQEQKEALGVKEFETQIKIREAERTGSARESIQLNNELREINTQKQQLGKMEDGLKEILIQAGKRLEENAKISLFIDKAYTFI